MVPLSKQVTSRHYQCHGKHSTKLPTMFANTSQKHCKTKANECSWEYRTKNTNIKLPPNLVADHVQTAQALQS